MHHKTILHNFLKTVNCIRFSHKWVQPEGFDTGIKVYNCITKNKVPLIVRNKDQVSWYTCGPTVYDSAHIGHASCYVKLDIIQRILRQHFKLNLITVMNITDIDDKIIKRSSELSVAPSELARKYENEFWNDLKDLNVMKPSIVLRVTDHMPIIINFVEALLQDNRAYVASDGSIYFDLSTCEGSYGKLEPVPENNSEKHGIKKSVGDFALWKNSKPVEPNWDTKWGPGRPGWHTECSALASAAFGGRVDIHAGGIDLRFPHHENEEAISCAHHHTTQWVDYWLHAGHLNLAGDVNKMSKSLGNCVTVRDLLKNKQSADAFRMACAMSHYRTGMEYGEELIRTAESQLNKFVSFLDECDAYASRLLPAASIDPTELNQQLLQVKDQIDQALKDDFNTARVIKIISKLIDTINKSLRRTQSVPTNRDLSDCAAVASIANFVREQFEMFGFSAQIIRQDRQEIDDKVMANILDVLIAFRHNVRNIGLQNKDTELLRFCDALRDELKMYGVQIKDRGKLSSWSKS